MDILDLRVFLQTAESQSMSRAAANVYMTQPAVSNRILQLEKELGAQLFVRGPSGAVLTEAGRRFYYFALYAYTAIERGKEALAAPGEEPDACRLRLGVVGNVKGVLSRAITEAFVAGSDAFVPWLMRTGESAELGLMVQTGQLDWGYVHEAPFPLPDVKIEPLVEADIVFIGPASAGARYRHLLTYIEKHPFILLKRGMPLRELLERQVFRELRVSPRTVIEVDTSEIIRMLVADGIGYSFLSTLTLMELSPKDIAILPTDAPLVRQRLCCVSKPDLPEHALRFQQSVNVNLVRMFEQFKRTMKAHYYM